MKIRISELIERLTTVKNNIGDVPIGIDDGSGISWLRNIRENTCYEFPSDNDEGIKFIEFQFG